MDSEIQFLLSLVLNHKLQPQTKKICLERIGQIEESLRSPQQPQRPVPQIQAQAPSMQRLIDQMPQPIIPAAPNIAPGPLGVPPALERDKTTGRANKITSVTIGGSTQGPSKVFR